MVSASPHLSTPIEREKRKEKMKPRSPRVVLIELSPHAQVHRRTRAFSSTLHPPARGGGRGKGGGTSRNCTEVDGTRVTMLSPGRQARHNAETPPSWKKREISVFPPNKEEEQVHRQPLIPIPSPFQTIPLQDRKEMAFDDCPRSMFLPCTSSKPQDLRTTPSRVEKTRGTHFWSGTG